ncbi:MAG: peptidase S8, partial [Ignavibacteriae bacterium 37-53-5]
YDVLGREVETLVDQNQVTGTYNVTIDGSRLASGIYFYQLRSGSYTSTKKMILMK